MTELQNLEVKTVQILADEQINSICDTDQEKSILKHLASAGFGQNENKLFFAAFVNQKLEAVLALAFAENRPWGSVIYLKINKSLETRVRLKVLREIVDRAFSQAEEKNCVRLYMVNRLQRRGNFMNARLYPLVKNIERLQKYSFITENIIPAHTKPQYEYEWQLLGYQTWSEDLGIVSATLKKYEITF